MSPLGRECLRQQPEKARFLANLSIDNMLQQRLGVVRTKLLEQADCQSLARFRSVANGNQFLEGSFGFRPL